MKIVRSILGLIVGVVVAMAAIFLIESTNFVLHKPADAPSVAEFGKLMEWMGEFQKDEDKVCAWIKALPIQVMVTVLVAWSVAAFVGAWVSARIAGWAFMVHAGLIGALVLVLTAVNFYEMKYAHNITHPDWMIALGLLLPLPISLLAGKLVSVRSTSPPASNS